MIIASVTFVAVYRAYMTRYRQKLERMTDDELEKEADRLYKKIVRFSAFFEFGQNYKRYVAVLDELEKRGLLKAS